MRIICNGRLCYFDFYGGAKETADNLTREQILTIEEHLIELHPDGMKDTELNDFFWFERDTIAEWLGFESYDELVNNQVSK